MCQSAQIANPQIFITNLQIANLQISTKYVLQFLQNMYSTTLFQNSFHYVNIYSEHYFFWTCGSFKPANHKKIGSIRCKSAKCHICGRSANFSYNKYIQQYKFSSDDYFPGDTCSLRIKVWRGMAQRGSFNLYKLLGRQILGTSGIRLKSIQFRF